MGGAEISITATYGGGWTRWKRLETPLISTRRDLVVRRGETQPRTSQTPYTRTSAAFLAHLIATAAQAPQTRERRRAEPLEAARHYSAAAIVSDLRGRSASQAV